MDQTSCYNCTKMATCYGRYALLDYLNSIPFLYPDKIHFKVMFGQVGDCCREFQPARAIPFCCPECGLYFYPGQETRYSVRVESSFEGETIEEKICPNCEETKHER